MNCVSCHEPLRRLASVLSVRAWICEKCKSVAAEIGSLANSVPRDRVAAIEKLREAPEGDRACPKCGAVMQRGPVGGGYGTIEVDACRACRIAWFDQGELRNLRAAAQPVRPSTLTPEQRSAARIQELREAGKADDHDSAAATLGLLLRIPIPEPVLGQVRPAYTMWAIAAIVTATSIAAFTTGIQDAAMRFGLIPEALSIGNLSPLLTHFFVHADPFHLAGNLAYFVVFGSRVEAIVGPVRLVFVVLVATIAGGLVHAIAAPDPSMPLIGASGGISGVLAAYVCLRPRSKIRWIFWLTPLKIPAYGFFAFWIVLQVVGVIVQVSGASAVSALGHLGGAATGLLIAGAFRQRGEAPAARLDPPVTPARP